MTLNHCQELETNLNDVCLLLISMHDMIALYIEKPVYGRLLSDLEQKQANFLLVLESIKKETDKSSQLKKEIESWSNELLNLMWKEQGNQSVKQKTESIKLLKNGFNNSYTTFM
jgi:hypothetical protein